MRAFFPIALLAAIAVALGAAASALGDSNVSSNWAGYAVHRPGVRFRQVSAVWRQPAAACRSGSRSYSAAWVGLGGYSESSNALEQIGTEVDCSGSGKVLSSAWYELVPAPSAPVNLAVRPGDTIRASVTVAGHRVDLRLDDVTRHRSFKKTLHPASVDVSSAEWIVEAPSECLTASLCQTLPLADFGATTFDSADAQSSSGLRGTISSHAWTATKITLSPGGQRFIAYQGSGPSAGAAQPSVLSAAGSAFSVAYQQVLLQSNPFFGARRSKSPGGYLKHVGRAR